MDFMGRRGGKWVKMKKQSIWDKGKTKTQKRVGQRGKRVGKGKKKETESRGGRWTRVRKKKETERSRWRGRVKK